MAARYKNALKYDKRDHMNAENDEEVDEIEREDAMSQSTMMLNQTKFCDAIINIYDLLKNWTHDMAIDVFDDHEFSIEDVSRFLSE